MPVALCGATCGALWHIYGVVIRHDGRTGDLTMGQLHEFCTTNLEQRTNVKRPTGSSSILASINEQVMRASQILRASVKDFELKGGFFAFHNYWNSKSCSSA